MATSINHVSSIGYPQAKKTCWSCTLYICTGRIGLNVKDNILEEITGQYLHDFEIGKGLRQRELARKVKLAKWATLKLCISVHFTILSR